MKNELVKLQVQVEVGKDIVIENYTAKSWDSFVIVTIPNLQYLQPDTVDALVSSLGSALEDKKIILIPAELEITLYGIREAE